MRDTQGHRVEFLHLMVFTHPCLTLRRQQISKLFGKPFCEDFSASMFVSFLAREEELL